MKIRIKKRNSILFVLFTLLLVTVSLLVYFLYLNKEKEVSVYDRLFEHCEEEDGIKQCYVFLKELKEEKDKTCMDLTLAEKEVERRDITVCFDMDIEWENPYKEYPYEEYLLPTPIVLNLQYGRRDSYSNPSKIGINLMDDEKAFGILIENIYNISLDVKPVSFMRTELYEDYKKGYAYFYNQEIQESGEPTTCLIHWY